MMAVIQNAFANSSSSLIQSKVAGHIVFVLLAPLSSLELFLAFVLAAVITSYSIHYTKLYDTSRPSFNSVGKVRV